MTSTNSAKLKKEVKPEPIVIYKTDTAVIVTNNSEIVSAIQDLGLKETETLTKLQEEKNKADLDGRVIKWVSNDIVFSVSATISIFIVGILVDRGFKWIEKRTKQKELKKYFISQVNKIQKGVVVPLKEGYRLIFNNTSLDSGILSTPPKVLSGEIKRVSEVKAGDLYQAIEEHDALSIILSQIDFVEQVQVEVEKFHILVRDRSQALRLKIQEILELYFNSFRDTIAKTATIESGNEPEPNILYLHMMLIKYNEEFTGKRVLSQLYNEIIRPTQIKIVEEKLYQDPSWKEIAEYGKVLSLRINELSELIKEFTNQYKTFYEHLSEAEGKINTNLPTINK